MHPKIQIRHSPILSPLFLLCLIIYANNISSAQTKECVPIAYELPFKKNVVTLSKANKAIVDSIMPLFCDDCQCKIKIEGSTAASELQQQLAWDRSSSLYDYLIAKGID